jgi:hypothetical protein
MFDWTRPHKKRVYLLSEGSQNDKRKARLLQYMFASIDNARLQMFLVRRVQISAKCPA